MSSTKYINTVIITPKAVAPKASFTSAVSSAVVAFVAAFAFLGTLVPRASADFTFSNVILTENSLSFDLVGSYPTFTGVLNQSTFLIWSPDATSSWILPETPLIPDSEGLLDSTYGIRASSFSSIWDEGHFIYSEGSYDVIGTNTSPLYLGGGAPLWNNNRGQYIAMYMTSPSQHEADNAEVPLTHYSMSWYDDVFDPSAVNSLQFCWGFVDEEHYWNLPISDGTFANILGTWVRDTSSVPEPATCSLVSAMGALGVACLVLLRRRKRSAV